MQVCPRFDPYDVEEEHVDDSLLVQAEQDEDEDAEASEMRDNKWKRHFRCVAFWRLICV